MNYKEFQDLLLYRVSANPTGASTEARDRVKLEATHVQKTILEQKGRYMPWFLLSTFQELTLSSGSSNIPFPADFLQEKEDSQPWYQDDTEAWVSIRKLPFDIDVNDLVATGKPKYYELTSSGINIYPKAEKDFTIRFRYYKREAELVNDTDTNSWLEYASDLFLAQTGFYLAKYHWRDVELEARFKEDAIVADDRLLTLSISKDNTNRPAAMGDD